MVKNWSKVLERPVVAYEQNLMWYRVTIIHYRSLVVSGL
jgi:hypothetical protein